MSNPVLIVGAGGHSQVLIDCLNSQGITILGAVDPRFIVGDVVSGNVKVLGSDNYVLNYSPDKINLVNGVGSLPRSVLREELFMKFSKMGYRFKKVIHSTAVIAKGVNLGQGVQIMAGVIIQPGCEIQENSIINTRAIVDHDCFIGPNSHIAPGAVLCGGVYISDSVHVGAGATLIQSIKIGKNSLIGAGSIVTKDIGIGKIVYPARSVIKELKGELNG